MATDLTTANEPLSDLDRIMQALANEGRDLPEDAIREARTHRDQIIPLLIRAIENATTRAAAGDTPKNDAHFFALFLLTEFRAKEALPAILAAVSLPGELPLDLFGDAITETLPRVLAVLACDTPEFLDALIQNRSLNRSVRWAALETLFFLVRDGRLTREYAFGRLRHHLREAITNRDGDIAEALVVESLSYVPTAAFEEIKEAFELDLVDPGMIGLDEVEDCISEGDSGFQNSLKTCRPTGIEDVIAELKTWHAYSDVRKWSSEVGLDEDLEWDELDEDFSDEDLDEEECFDEEDWSQPALPPVPEPIHNTTLRIGRNDPCPCGSGKKFKKCCGGRSVR